MFPTPLGCGLFLNACRCRAVPGGLVVVWLRMRMCCCRCLCGTSLGHGVAAGRGAVRRIGLGAAWCCWPQCFHFGLWFEGEKGPKMSLCSLHGGVEAGGVLYGHCPAVVLALHGVLCGVPSDPHGKGHPLLCPCAAWTHLHYCPCRAQVFGFCGVFGMLWGNLPAVRSPSTTTPNADENPHFPFISLCLVPTTLHGGGILLQQVPQAFAQKNLLSPPIPVDYRNSKNRGSKERDNFLR